MLLLRFLDRYETTLMIKPQKVTRSGLTDRLFLVGCLMNFLGAWGLVEGRKALETRACHKLRNNHLLARYNYFLSWRNLDGFCYVLGTLSWPVELEPDQLRKQNRKKKKKENRCFIQLCRKRSVWRQSLIVFDVTSAKMLSNYCPVFLRRVDNIYTALNWSHPLTENKLKASDWGRSRSARKWNFIPFRHVSFRVFFLQCKIKLFHSYQEFWNKLGMLMLVVYCP